MAFGLLYPTLATALSCRFFLLVAAVVGLCVLGCGENVVEPIGTQSQSGPGVGAAGSSAGGAGPVDNLSRDLVAYWKLDEISGLDGALDEVGGHTGLPVDAPLPTDDVPNVTFPNVMSRSFDGQGQYLLVANSETLDFSGQITLAAWVKLNGLSSECQYVIGHGYCLEPPGEVVLRVGTDTCGPGSARHYWAAGAWLSGEHSAVAPVLDSDLGVWLHVAATYVDLAWHLYRNGEEIATEPSVVGAVPVASDWAIGARAPGPPPCVPGPAERFFNGSIDEVRVYRRALSAAEIEELYHL